jgi:hypothetical protein
VRARVFVCVFAHGYVVLKLNHIKALRIHSFPKKSLAGFEIYHLLVVYEFHFWAELVLYEFHFCVFGRSGAATPRKIEKLFGRGSGKKQNDLKKLKHLKKITIAICRQQF